MIDPHNVPQVTPDEMLARYILQSSHLRRSDATVKPDAFIPHPHRELSVTRHLSATEDEVWAVGESIAATIGKTIHGRGDILASACFAQKLVVKATPTAPNPNHADVDGWPADKPAQKIVAQELAAAATFIKKL